MSTFNRVILIILDGVGVGALPDAVAYGDAGANTLRHVAEQAGPLELPYLQRLGLGNICPAPGLPPAEHPAAAWGKMKEKSPGKDTTTGHWELAGLETTEPFASYPEGFPPEIVELFRQATGLDLLGNIAASGTDIIRDLGAEHLRTGAPIVYTSVDSVFQIAAHEEVVPPDQLYQICREMRGLLDPYRIGRVIARPFVGTVDTGFTRTHRRRDFSMPPSAPTVLDLLQSSGVPVVAIGKISDIFVGRGVAETIKSRDNDDGMRQIMTALDRSDRGLIFANLVDFDMLYGHRLDAAGFAGALADFDRWLPGLMQELTSDDLLIITADHGCDPTTDGTDHTREFVPLLLWSKGMQAGMDLGISESFRDVAATVAAAFGQNWQVGNDLLA